MNELFRMVEQNFEQQDLAIYLNNLSPEDRLREIRSLKGKEIQEKLFKIANPNATLNDLIPAEVPALQSVTFHGFNSLPAFNQFQKRMCRSRDGQWVWGYNHQALAPVTGPGYFIAGENSDRAEKVVFDYNKVPPEQAAGWPKAKSNANGIGHLVYGNLKDYMRKVAHNVFIGEAKKGAKTVGYFILCREDAPKQSAYNPRS